MSAEKSVGETEICAGCGLCCDGTMFGHVIVVEEDQKTVAKAQLRVTELEGTPIFRLPCEMLMNGLCSVYDARPSTCRRYRCKLRKSVDTGELGEPEALEKIAAAKDMAQRLRQSSDGAKTLGERRALTAKLKDGFADCGEPERLERAKLLLELAAFEFYVNCWFREER